MPATLDDKVFRELRAKIGELAIAKVKIGILQGGDKEVETEHGALSIVELATIHEFGAPGAGIPARSFIRETFDSDEGRAAQAEFMAKQAEQIISGELAPKTALKRVGAWGAARVRARIKAHIAPALKPETIQRKKSSTPLVDTGALINSVSWELEEDESPGGSKGEK